MRRKVIVGVCALAVVGGALLLRSRGPRLSDEQLVVQAIVDLRRAVEAKDAGGALRQVSDSYSDGTYTKRELAGLVVEAFRSPEPFHVQAEAPAVTVKGESAIARLRVQLWVGKEVAVQDRQDLDITAEFRREGKRWKLVKASRWEAAGGRLE